jgi:tripartite-type tricarboxylate transporter receptor subunit TctC
VCIGSYNCCGDLVVVIVKVLGAGDLREMLSGQGLEPQPGTPEQFAEFLRTELAKNTKLIKATGASAL